MTRLTSKTGDTAAMRWTSKIIGYGEAEPDQLLANPMNWRIHPRQQQDVLKAALAHIGWIAPVIVNKRTGHVVDGHLRVLLAMENEAQQTVPVAFVDLTEDEELKALATLDPIGVLAGKDAQQFDELVAQLAPMDDPVLAKFIASLAAGTPSASDEDQSEAIPLAGAPSPCICSTMECPRCGNIFNPQQAREAAE